jgi:uncharacterized protein with HEPN domain
VSPDRIWNVIEIEIPKLIAAISIMVEELPAEDDQKTG